MHVAAVAQGGMTLTADLYFSFRSPYSYLAIGRYRAMAEEWDCRYRASPGLSAGDPRPEFF